jgi:hypothetical protein
MWEDRYKLPGKQAKSVDGMLLGKVREMENDYVLTDGEPNFYIPRYLIEKYDGSSLWFKIDSDEAKSKFMLGTSPTPSPF